MRKIIIQYMDGKKEEHLCEGMVIYAHAIGCLVNPQTKKGKSAHFSLYNIRKYDLIDLPPKTERRTL